MNRTGTIIIIVAGLAALIVALTVGFLVRVRADADDMAVVVQESQLRAMLIAGMQYIGEGARIGWDDPNTPTVREETYGWRDVRDGRAGPRDQFGQPARDLDGNDLILITTGASPSGAGRYPAVDGVAARCPMDVMRRPPFAISRRLVYDPIDDPQRSWVDLIRNSEKPLPAVADYTGFSIGDAQPLIQTVGLAWFRVRRTGIATFIITCGAGASAGFRSWQEVIDEGATDHFTSRATFD